MDLGVLQITMPNQVHAVEDKFTNLYKGVGKLKDCQVTLHIRDDVRPVAQGVRRIPYSLRSKVDAKLKELEEKDIIERVNGPTPWVNPVVVVPKRDGDIRLCVDMRRANE